MIEVQAIESSARDSRSGLPRSSSGRTPSKIETGRIRTPRQERGLTSGPDPGKGSGARTHLVVLPEGEEARDAPVSARQPRSSGASRPVPPPPPPRAERRSSPPGGPAARPHAPAAGRPRPPTRCPPRGAARRRLCARPGPARRGRERALRWPGALRVTTPSSRVRVLLTNGPGARGGRRRGSPA